MAGGTKFASILKLIKNATGPGKFSASRLRCVQSQQVCLRNEWFQMSSLLGMGAYVQGQ